VRPIQSVPAPGRASDENLIQARPWEHCRRIVGRRSRRNAVCPFFPSHLDGREGLGRELDVKADEGGLIRGDKTLNSLRFGEPPSSHQEDLRGRKSYSTSRRLALPHAVVSALRRESLGAACDQPRCAQIRHDRWRLAACASPAKDVSESIAPDQIMRSGVGDPVAPAMVGARGSPCHRLGTNRRGKSPSGYWIDVAGRRDADGFAGAGRGPRSERGYRQQHNWSRPQTFEPVRGLQPRTSHRYRDLSMW